MRNQDLTKTCLEPGVTEMDLRKGACITCRNPVCMHAQRPPSSEAWMERMSTQVDRLLLNPNILQEGHDDIRNMDFPSLLNEAIRIGAAVSKGDWSITPKHDLAWRPPAYVGEPDTPADSDPTVEPAATTEDEISEIHSDSFTESMRALKPSAVVETSQADSVLEPSTDSGDSVDGSSEKNFVIEKVVVREPPSNPVGHAPPAVPPTSPVTPPTSSNTKPQGGMIGEEPRTQKRDDWTASPKVSTVPIGSKIKM